MTTTDLDFDAVAGRADAKRLFEEAVRHAAPARIMPALLPDPRSGELVVIAAGKAAAEMMRVAQLRRGPRANLKGLVVTRHGHLPTDAIDWPGVEIIEAGHPYPDGNSLRAGDRALEIAADLRSGDHLLVLLSGGASALLAAPAEGLDLGDKQQVTRALLRSGATIEEVNCVRKHLSRIKGGRLAKAAYPATVTTWIVSDVPGDDPSSIASGPTVPDSTTLEDARNVLERYGIAAPSAVQRALADRDNETPAADSPGLVGSETRIIARPGDALAAATSLARAMGYEVMNLGDRIEGEAREVGRDHAALACKLAGHGGRHAIISGGETSVTVTNPKGRGGRNMEYALALAIALDGAAGIHALACDTDGIDGTENAAGALVTPDTLARAALTQVDAAECLAGNNAYLFFEALGDLVVTGPTLTNVNDFRVILIGAGGRSE